MNSAYSSGGVIASTNSVLIMEVSSCTFTSNSAPIGGVFYLTSLAYLSLTSVTTTENTGEDGRVIYSTAANTTFSITSSTFIGTVDYQYTSAYALL
jgi:hypothetical protein